MSALNSLPGTFNAFKRGFQRSLAPIRGNWQCRYWHHAVSSQTTWSGAQAKRLLCSEFHPKITFGYCHLYDTINAIIKAPRGRNAAVGVVCNTALVCMYMYECTCMSVSMYVQVSAPVCLSVCMYMYECTCMSVSMYWCECTCMSVSMYVQVSALVCLSVCMYRCECTCMSVRMYVQVWVYLYVCECIYRCECTCMHVSIYVQMWVHLYAC